jgi:16S rRNA (cytosine1402-N4)-methyltransferase
MPNTRKPYHIPVLVDEVLEYIAPKPHGIYVDATFGGGGHSRALLEYEPTCVVIGLDWDLTALEQGAALQDEFPGRLELIWGNFSQIDTKLKKEGFGKVDGILADFGTSQFQLFERPGFSFYKDSPLDMRMSPAHQKITAAEVVNTASEKELITILQEFGQEPQARAIVRLIMSERIKKRITTTNQLVALIQQVTGPKGKNRRLHPATKVFQALRIFVNRELDNIWSFLPAAVRSLKPGGRLVCISFHSLEDRMVKRFFKELSVGSEASAFVLTPKAVRPSQQEIARNPASRSALLRALEINKE